ncbi:MAG: response regulator [Pseudomonadota bacterium]
MSNLAQRQDIASTALQPQFSEILILDDNEFDRKRLRRAISQLQIARNFTEAADLRSFSHQIEQKAFDIILFDFALGDGDGVQALDLCKRSTMNAHALFVMVTGNDSSALAVRALKHGFDDYLSKDEVSYDVMSNFVQAAFDKQARARKPNLMAFNRPNPSRPVFDTPAREKVSRDTLADLLERRSRSAVDAVVSRIQAEEYRDSVASIYGLDDIGFVFKEWDR